MRAFTCVPFLLAACTGGMNDAELIAKAKSSAAGQVGIPSTASFRNVKLSEEVGADLIRTVCGEVSGTSVDGLNVGFTRFVYSPAIGDAIVAFDPKDYVAGAENDNRIIEFRAAFDEMWTESCA